MSKRKNTDQSKRFVWKRNCDYDYLLLVEVQSTNPYAFQNQKSVWTDIAKTLSEGRLKMKVTHRSCRERTTELLKKYRKEDLESIQASGVCEEEMTDLQKLLASVSMMDQTKPDKQVSTLYLKNDKQAAEAIRAAALMEVDVSDSSNDEQCTDNADDDDNSCRVRYEAIFGREMTLQEDYDLMMTAEQSSSGQSASGQSASEQSLSEQSASESEQLTLDDIQSGSLESQPSTMSTAKPSTISTAKQSASSSAASHKAAKPPKPAKPAKPDKPSTSSNDRFSNPKKDLVKYLEKKSSIDFDIRREELLIRQKETENNSDARRDELRIREKEIDNKTEELRIERLKAEAEVEERKKFNELLVKLIIRD